MSCTVYRTERDGTETVIACVDDMPDACIVIEEDMRKIDWETGYRVVTEGEA